MANPIFEKTVVKIETEEQLTRKFEELAHALHNLRFFTKYWNEHGGYQARQRMKFWQEKADDLLDGMGLTLHRNINSITVIKH